MLSATTSLILAALLALPADDFPAPYDSQPGPGGPVTPEKALAGMKLPDGFRASLFAAEPDVRQPIAIAIDDRGRLWVAENYTYAEVKAGYDDKLRDRILIFEDTNNDGKYDKRTVFWDRGNRMTSVEVGFGGVFVVAPPSLLFIPDRDGDDKPDGPPEVLLDGFKPGERNHHTLANGLKWGPDGWLHGRQGIQDTSFVGAPGTPENKRVPINGSIWRYHPTRKVFEVVCEGTTNPWGLDWDRHGEGFFINTVIGHLWHIVPGAHYVRMFGQDPGPLYYGLIDQTADHFHWDTRDNWVVTRTAGVTDGTDRAGGGHAHTGLLIYQGANWPDAYRDELFAINFHGRRLNRDHLERSGATYVGKHRPDFVSWSDPWFRGIDLISGPDGGVFVADWSDTGECHENDGVHRSSGRLFKIVHGTPNRPEVEDVSKLSDQELVRLQSHKDVWYSRHARRVLQERAARGVDMSLASAQLSQILATSGDVVLRLRALWCLHAMDRCDEKMLIGLLDDADEHIRTWGIRLLFDAGTPTEAGLAAIRALATKEQSGLVLTHIASGLRRLGAADRFGLAETIMSKSRFAADPVLPHMVWFALESVTASDPSRAATLAAGPKFGEIRRYLARRLAQESDRPDLLAPMLAAAARPEARGIREEILAGIADAHVQDRKAPKPKGWDELAKAAGMDADPSVSPLVQELNVLFGDPSELAKLKDRVNDSSLNVEDRRRALRAVIRFRPEGTSDLLRTMLSDKRLSADAVRGLAGFSGDEIPKILIASYPSLSPEAKVEAVTTLAARPASTELLLRQIKGGGIDRKEIPAFVVSQMRGHMKAPIPALLAELWPVSAKAKERIEGLKTKLSDGRLPKASLDRGRTVFQKTCAQCHKLFGEGGAIGPELTGAQRSDLGYLLENILDPSATLAPDHAMSVFALKDGRVINGIATERTANSVTIQTPTEKIVIAPADIEAERKSNLSLMPEGLLDTLSETQVTDLIRYLQSSKANP